MGCRFVLKVFGTALLVNALYAAERLPSDMGVYLGWVGSYPGDRLREGIERAKRLGFRTVRMPLYPSILRDAGASDVCLTGWPLARIAEYPAVRRVLADPSVTTILLTAYDGFSADFCNGKDLATAQPPSKRYLDIRFMRETKNRIRILNEYRDLALALHRPHKNTGKTFGIANWEGDNDLHCGSAWNYANDAVFRAQCDARWPLADRLAALREYYLLRLAGIAEGRRIARQCGYNGTRILSVVEFSAVRFLREKNLPNMLDDVIPFLPQADLYSYSAWESIGGDAVHETALADFTWLKERFGDRLVVGEFGFDRSSCIDAPLRARTVIKVVRRLGIRYAIFWQMFDQPPLEGGRPDEGKFGLYDRSGGKTADWKQIFDN